MVYLEVPTLEDFLNELGESENKASLVRIVHIPEVYENYTEWHIILTAYVPAFDGIIKAVKTVGSIPSDDRTEIKDMEKSVLKEKDKIIKALKSKGFDISPGIFYN